MLSMLMFSSKWTKKIHLLSSSKREIGNLYIGSNVKQRPQLGENFMEGTKVVAINGTKNIKLVSRILQDQGAEIQMFNYEKLRIKDIQLAIKYADILLDGIQNGGDIEDAATMNKRLIVAQCDCDDPFSAMTAAARIAMAMIQREKSSNGQRLIAVDSLDYWRILNKFSHDSR